MKKLAPAAAALLAALALWPLAAAGAEPAAPAEPKRGPLAVLPVEWAVLTVNGRPITRSYLMLMIRRPMSDEIRGREERQRNGSWTPQQEAEFNARMGLAWKWALREVVFCEILRNEAERMTKFGLQVTDRDVERRWREMLQEAGGAADLAREQGISLAALKDLARDELMAEAYRQSIRSRHVRPTPREISDYYRDHSEEFRRPETVRARIIAVKRFVDDGSGRRTEREGARRRAEEALSLACKKPEDFAALAEKYSEDPASAPQGGLIGAEKDGGLVERGAYEAALDRMLFSLQPGELSGIVEGGNNLYVVQVLKRFAAGVPPMEEIAEAVERRCFRERLRRIEEKFFRELYDKVLVQDDTGQRIATADKFLASLAPAPKPPPAPTPGR